MRNAANWNKAERELAATLLNHWFFVDHTALFSEEAAG
jgi:hypothetical protein